MVSMRAAAWTSLSAIALGGATALACSAPPAPTSSNSSNVDDGLAIEFPTMYSAFDGQHEFKLPAMVEGVKKVKWSASDPAMVDLEPQADGATVMITTRKAGTVTIKAESGSLTGTAQLTITD